jgi:hypothetical protein
MRDRLTAYACYAIGSCVFLVSGLVAGSPLVLAGSSLFLAGTVVLAVQELRRVRRGLVQDGRSRVAGQRTSA